MSKGLTLVKVFLLIVFLETYRQIWVNFPDSDLKSLIFLFLFKSLCKCRFGNFLNSLTLNFNHSQRERDRKREREREKEKKRQREKERETVR